MRPALDTSPAALGERTPQAPRGAWVGYLVSVSSSASGAWPLRCKATCSRPLQSNERGSVWLPPPDQSS